MGAEIRRDGRILHGPNGQIEPPILRKKLRITEIPYNREEDLTIPLQLHVPNTV